MPGVLAVYAAGLLAGVQIALYLFDLYDDGVADLRSLMIGLVMVAAGLAFALRRFWSGRHKAALRDLKAEAR